ncbi:MAG: hypothetical protein AAGH68_13245 [Pseudomonadota bacterium]
MTEPKKEIAPETRAQLNALDIEPGRPLIAVDADEVLVVFVDHLSRWMETIGFEMRLVRYQLEGSMFPKGSDQALPFDECIALINRFFAEQTLAQRAVPGAAEALARLAEDAQIVVLTNVPRGATEARRENLSALGIPYPVVVNSGGKGRAMAWLAAQAGAPTAFIDDSVKQIESVANRAPDVVRLHFAWADFIFRIYPECAEASCQVRDWDSAERELRSRLGLR